MPLTDSSTIPQISFIVPVRNGEGTLKDALNSIHAQRTNLSFEILVINNQSSDSSEKIAKESNVTLLHEVRIGRSFARNKGIEFARGKWICFIDSDVILDIFWLRSFEILLSENFFDIFQCQIIPGSLKKNSFFKFREQLILSLTNGTFNYLDTNRFTGPMCNTAACLVRKSCILNINGFDPQLNTYEDADLSWRLWKNGASFCVVNDAIAWVYWDQGGYSSYLKRSFNMGQGYALFLTKWGIKKMASIVPVYRRYQYQSWLDQIYDFFLQFSFSVGYQVLSSSITSVEFPFHRSKVRKNKKILKGKSVCILNPYVRILKTSDNLILRDIRIFKTLKIPLSKKCPSRDDIFELLLENQEEIVSSDFAIFMLNSSEA